MSGHTKGPWWWRGDPGSFRALESDAGHDVLYAEEYAGIGWIEVANEHDATLIVKAPAMHDALHSARHALANASMAAHEGQDGRLAKVVAEIDAALGGDSK